MMAGPTTESIQKALKQLVNYLEPLLPFANCHMVNYLTHDHWNTLLNEEMRKDLENLPIEELIKVPTAALGIENEEVDELCSQGNNLISFMAAVRKHHLCAMNVLTPLEKVLEHHGEQDISILKMKGRMSEKKMHEVDIMSNMVARIAKGKNSNYIVDAGSGKGYLSSSLALQYNLKVLAIDSSCTNTSSAIQRNKRVQNYWETLKRSEKDKADGKPVKGKNWRKKQNKKDQEDHRKKSEQGDENQSNTDKNQEEKNDETLKFTVKDNVKVDTDSNGKYIGITHFLLQDTNLTDLINQSFNDPKYQLETLNSSEVKLSNKTCVEMSNDSLVYHKVDNINPLEHFKNNPKLGIVGLHTCGNLASISLKLFVSSPSVHFLCNVGCCYHLLQEEFCNDTYTRATPNQIKDEDISSKDDRYENCSLDPLHPKENPNSTSVGFPLSSYLKQRKFQLGRNARNLAAKATDRLASQQTINNTSLYWRALLQVLLREKIEAVPESFQIGRGIAAKSPNFYEYVKKTTKKLELKFQVTESDINTYLEEYSLDETRLQRFCLLVSSLAPIIEGLILLDRVSFLSEKEDLTSAHLVQLFDPVASPRCHAVVAFRSST